MPKHKSKTEQARDVTATEVTKVKSEVENFQQKWGMELTQQETDVMIRELTSQLAKSEEGVKIRPAVRNEMFAMLIEKDPEKAISFRMEAYEKRGKTISKEDKEHIKEVAREGGWKAARMELKEMFKERRTRRKRPKTEEVRAETAQAPTRKVQAAVKRQRKAARLAERKAETAQAEDRSQGLTADEMIQAKIKMYDSANAQITVREQACEKKMGRIRDKYLEKFSEQHPEEAEIVKEEKVAASDSEAERAVRMFSDFLDANPGYGEEIAAAEEEMHAEIAKPKADRDRLGGEIYAAIQKEYLKKDVSQKDIKVVEREGNWSSSAGMTRYYRDETKMSANEVRLNTIHMDNLVRGMEGRWKVLQARKKKSERS